MKGIKNKYLTAIIVGIFAVIYNILVFVIKDMDNAGGNFWGGYVFTMLAFVVVAGLSCLTSLSKSRSLANYSPVYFGAIAYFVISLIVNIIFICLDKDTNTTAMIVINVILVLLFGAYAILMYMSIRHMGQTSQKIAEKRQQANVMEISLGSLIDMAKDAQVKQSLVELQERVRYGGRVGSDAPAEVLSAQDSLKNQIEVIKILLSSGADSEALLTAIEQAKNLLRTRDELLVAYR